MIYICLILAGLKVFVNSDLYMFNPSWVEGLRMYNSSWVHFPGFPMTDRECDVYTVRVTCTLLFTLYTYIHEVLYIRKLHVYMHYY